MKNKIITNIILTYFVVISIVLLVQIVSRNREIQDPVSEKIPLSENLNDAVVLYNESPVMLVNTRQSIVDSTNSDLVPVIKENVFYAPINFFKEAYGATVSFNESKNTATVRLNNIAWVLDKTTGSASLVDSYGEEAVELKNSVIFENKTAYIALEDFATAFDKNVYFYQDNMAVVSGSELDTEETEVLEQLKLQVNDLPCIINSSNLRQLLGKNAYGLPNLAIENILKPEEEQLEVKESIFSFENEYTYAVSESYIYIINDGKVQIIDTNLSTSEPVSQLFMEPNTKAEKIVLNNDRLIVFGKLGNESDYSSVMVYDIVIKAQPQLLNEFQTVGEISDFVFRNENMVFVTKAEAGNLIKDKEYIAPFYYNDGEYTELSFEDIRYMPKIQDKIYTTVFSLNLYDTTVENYSIFGAGDNLYLDNNGKYFYVCAKRSPSGFEDTCILAFNLVDGICYNNKICLTGFEECKNLYTFNNHIFVMTENNNKNILYILDNSLNIVNEMNSIVFNTEVMDFIGERIYLQNKKNNLTFIDINDVNNCKQAYIVPMNEGIKLYPYKENYFVALDNNTLSILDMNDMESVKTLSSVEIQGKVKQDSLVVLKDGVSVGVTVAASESTTGTKPSTSTENTQLVNVQAMYEINDNFNIIFAGNISHTDENNMTGIPVNDVIKVGDKYITVSESKLLVSDNKFTPLFAFEK